MHRSLFSINRVAAILVMGSAVMLAQGTQTANMTGEVRDDAKAPLAGATIRVTSPSMQGSRTVTSDEKGRFNLRLLPPGTYQIEVWKTGFQTFKISEKLGIEQNYQPTIIMTKVQGAIVEVIATASAAIDKSDVKVQTNFRGDDFDELPTLNRTPETMAAMAPGVTDNGVGGRVQIRGAMTSGNLNLLDGQNISDATYNTRGIQVIEDSLEEVQVVTGAISAEYGNVDGGVINSITKSGSNSFSGSLRWDMSNPQWNAVVPYENQAANANMQSSVYTFTVGGPVIKDKLWFFASYFRNTSNTTNNIAGNSADLSSIGAGSAYNYNQDEIRRQIKLTYAINQDHTLVAAFMNNSNVESPRDYLAGDQNALSNEVVSEGFYSLSLRSIWSPSITSEVRYGQKRETLTAGSVTDATPIYDDTTGLFYTAGLFNMNDGGDHRNNRTANAKVSIFWDASGSHQTDIGLDFYRGERSAANDQSATNMIYEVAQYNPGGVAGATPTTVLNPEDLWVFQSDTRQAVSTTYGLYGNDKWSLNKNWNFQIGLRYDKYTAQDLNGNTVVSADGISPRLGVNYDILGDSVWLVKASWARYNTGVADQIAQVVTNAGNPTEINYGYQGPGAGNNNNVQPISVVTNPANYPLTTSNIVYYSNPVVNVALSNDLKSPHVDEAQLQFSYSFKTEAVGNGYLRVTTVNKKWSDLFDYTQGNNGTVTDFVGNVWSWKVWENSPIATRKYKDLEVEAHTEKAGWLFDYNITWSDLEGNYQGEGQFTPYSGQGLSYFTYVNGQQMYNPALAAPYGKLIGDVPLRMRGTLTKIVETSWGKTTIGFIYRLDSGTHTNITRQLPATALNPTFNTTTALSYGSAYSQYYNNTLGNAINPGTAFLDLALTQDFVVGKVGDTNVNMFVKLAITNVLNHQQPMNYNWSMNPGTNLTDPWVPVAGFGQANNAGNYVNSWTGVQDSRSILISAGIKF